MRKWLGKSAPTLREALEDWTDADKAAFLLGAALGCWPGTEEAWEAESKRFWTDDPFGTALTDMLERLVVLGILVMDEEARFRWREGAR